MTPELRNSLVIARTGDYFNIMRTTIFTLTAVAVVIQLGPEGFSAPLAMLVIATTAFGVLAGGTSLDDVINLRDDMDDATAQTTYGKGVGTRNIPMLKMISSVLLGLIGLAELFVICF